MRLEGCVSHRTYPFPGIVGRNNATFPRGSQQERLRQDFPSECFPVTPRRAARPPSLLPPSPPPQRPSSVSLVPGADMAAFPERGRETALQFNKAVLLCSPCRPQNCLSVPQISAKLLAKRIKHQMIKWPRFYKVPHWLQDSWRLDFFLINRWICFSSSPSLFLNKCSAL